MNTKNFLNHLILGVLLLTTGKVASQVTTGGNVAAGPTDFLGWDNTMPNNNFPLVVKHELNQPIEWWTNNSLRMRLHPTLINQVVNGYNTVDLSGNLGVGLFNAITGSEPITRPLTLLHLDNGGTESAGFRDWMRTGVTMTHLSDLIYVGLKQDTAEINTAAIVWSDNNQVGTIGPDRLRFIFTRAPGPGTVAASDEGLEIARMIPAANGNEGFVGIGDWQSVSWDANPLERLDILDGRVRIRQLPSDTAAVDSFYVMVVDRTLGDERGVVKWMDPNDLPGGGGVDCDWEITPNLDVVTAYDQSAPSGCPNDESRVGIGIDRPDAKLHVYNDWENMLGTAGFFHNVYGSQVASGLNALCEGGGTVIGARGRATMGGRNIGVWGIADNGPTCVGTRGEAYGTAGNTGVEGTAYGGGTSTGLFGLGGGATNVNFGVSATGAGGTVAYGINATGQFGGLANYGIRAAAFGFNAYAGWFDGDTWTTGTGWYNNGLFSISDGSLKTAIEPIENALDLVMQLAPKRYLFNVEAHPHMQLSAEPQIGLIAQEVAETVPELVGATVYPAQFDSLGNMTSEALSLKGVDYAKLGPLLVGAIQEQQRMISELQQQHHALQTALANCCAAHGNDADQRSGSIDNSQLSDAASERLLTIAPNPFTDRTKVSYTLERGGRAQLLVNSSDGKHLQVLEEGVRSEGQYNYTWSTAHLAPGVYYVTLLLDGEPLVKRAVKVQ